MTKAVSVTWKAALSLNVVKVSVRYKEALVGPRGLSASTDALRPKVLGKASRPREDLVEW